MFQDWQQLRDPKGMTGVMAGSSIGSNSSSQFQGLAPDYQAK